MRPIVRHALRIYFSDVQIQGLENLGSPGPRILTCNHPASFMEACLLACFLPRSVYFLTRGDVMKSRRLLWFFRNTHQIPIYRFRDGYSDMRKNVESFRQCYEVLENGATLVIFVEGSTSMVKQLRVPQMGFGRIAFGALSRKCIDALPITAIGVNFQSATIGGGYAVIKIGETLESSEYLKDYQQQPRETLKLCTQRIHEMMRPCVIHLEDSSREPVLNDIIDSAEILMIDMHQRVLRDQQFADQIDDLQVDHSSSAIKRVCRPPQGAMEQLQNVLLMLCHFSIGIPSIVSRRMAEHLIDQPEFSAPLRIGLAIILFPIWLGTIYLVSYSIDPRLAAFAVMMTVLYLVLWKVAAQHCAEIFPRGRAHYQDVADLQKDINQLMLS